MASSPMASSTQSPRPNLVFRQLRGPRSPGEFAAAVRRAAREIGERVSCDARYVGRVEAGEIRCPNYAYERVFLHMFPGRTLTDMGFTPRSQVRGRGARDSIGAPLPHTTIQPEPTIQFYESHPTGSDPRACDPYAIQIHEESDVERRAFMTGSTATVAAALGPIGLSLGGQAWAAGPRGRRADAADACAVEEAVRRIRLLDDRHGADGLYRRAAAPLRAAYTLLDASTTRQSTSDRLHAGAGELAISVGWLAHDSGRFDDARSHYAEALATARMSGDHGVEAHAFCNSAFLARDAGRPREAVRAAQAATGAARHLGSHRLLSLVALREAGGWAGLGDRAGCEQSLTRAHALFDRGATERDPEWMSFYGPAELEGLEAQCWSALGDWERAARHARLAAVTASSQTPQFTRNIALYTAELADDLARAGRPDEAATAGLRVLSLLGEVQSSRIQSMLATTARVLLPHRRASGVSGFLERHASLPRVG
ncbi:tetratricopeptide repeat protein [Streptomyces kanamyceticus]|uniref:Tetratricopeptide repeat protein n=1 Tax=Streptomyces kanamyceticus TaxID=1967 RepID=A0A5J6GJS0_STRKN|nr:tetratricopeptide repeat protein [Streptomyces kanamyceticus]QEU94195.1 tetratricopeptide repeat protein [Streptomyces kanamyceticus]